MTRVVCVDESVTSQHVPKVPLPICLILVYLAPRGVGIGMVVCFCSLRVRPIGSQGVTVIGLLRVKFGQAIL